MININYFFFCIFKYIHMKKRYYENYIKYNNKFKRTKKKKKTLCIYLFHLRLLNQFKNTIIIFIICGGHKG